MSPLSLLIDHSQLLGRVQTLYSFAPAEETSVVDGQHDERVAQVKGLVTGTLLFMPFLMAYVVACASR